MFSPLTTRMSHRDGDLSRTQVPDSWIIQPEKEAVCQLRSSVLLHIPSGAFSDSSGTVIHKPIQLKASWLECLPDFINQGRSGYHTQGIFSSLIQFNLSATRAQSALRIIKPLILEWEVSAEHTMNGLQLAYGAMADWQALFHTQSPGQWRLQHQGNLQIGRSQNSRFLFRLSLPQLGWWSLGFLHLCEYESRILRIQPIPSLDPLEHARAIWLLPNWNTYLEIPASPKGFATFRIPQIKQGSIQISACHQGQWWWGEESAPLSTHKMPWRPLKTIQG